MDPMILILGATFVGTAALAWLLSTMFAGSPDTRVEGRLQALAGGKASASSAVDGRSITKAELINSGTSLVNAALRQFASRFENLGLFFQQADSPINLETCAVICAVCAGVGVVSGLVASVPPMLIPLCGAGAAPLPFVWLWWRRKSRFSKFANQLPDAMELIARALRSGHSLNSGLSLVVQEMPAPIAQEFRIAFEEQNLGIPIEQALKNMLARMPNLDLKFFVTAVAIQRQTGGDLAEILDKIGYVIRERFKILGTVQALTGEGRLSGVVLMVLPVAIFFAVLYLNPDYVMLLFTTDLGKKMIGLGIVMQILGAITINKIIDIKV